MVQPFLFVALGFLFGLPLAVYYVIGRRRGQILPVRGIERDFEDFIFWGLKHDSLKREVTIVLILGCAFAFAISSLGLWRVGLIPYWPTGITWSGLMLAAALDFILRADKSNQFSSSFLSIGFSLISAAINPAVPNPVHDLPNMGLLMGGCMSMLMYAGTRVVEQILERESKFGVHTQGEKT